MLCDATTYYVLRAFPYVGKEEDRASTGLGEFVTLSLLEPYQNVGLNVTCDNFFTSLSLAKKLLQQHTTIVGTIRGHRREIPNEICFEKDAALYSSNFFFTLPPESIMILSYKAKKNKVVFLLSSEHKTVEVHEGEKRKPKAILDYNKNKGGVDTADEMLRSYSSKASSRRWPLAAFFNLLDIVSLNTYLICKDITLSAQNRRQFLIKLGEELWASERSRQHEMPHLLRFKRIRDRADEDLPPTKRTKCSICNSNKTRTKCGNCSRYVCGTCSTPMCKDCINLEQE